MFLTARPKQVETDREKPVGPQAECGEEKVPFPEEPYR